MPVQTGFSTEWLLSGRVVEMCSESQYKISTVITGKIRGRQPQWMPLVVWMADGGTDW